MNLVRTKENRFPTIWGDFFENEWFPFSQINKRQGGNTPAVNISEDKDRYVLDLAVPGLNKEDINIDVEDNTINISAESRSEKSNEKNGEITRREFNYSSFSRSFLLPDNVDAENIKANYQDGILEIVLPKLNKVINDSVRKIEVN